MRHRPEEIERTGEIPRRPPSVVAAEAPRPVNYGAVLGIAAAMLMLVLVTSWAAWALAEWLSEPPVWHAGVSRG